jgi:hypothetical protein
MFEEIQQEVEENWPLPSPSQASMNMEDSVKDFGSPTSQEHIAIQALAQLARARAAGNMVLDGVLPMLSSPR